MSYQSINRRSSATLAALLVSTAALGGDATVPVGPLPHDVQPLAYRLELTVLPEQAEFTGITEMDLELKKPTRLIWLHGNGLKVGQVELTTRDGAQHAGRYEQVDDTGVARLDFDATIPAGRASLRFVYSGPFSKGSEGLYHTTVAGKSYAFTQFESIDARRMFPGFDEPAFKTPFDVAVTTTATNSVIGNAPVRSEEAAGADLKRVVFQQTRPLPTYLLALAVGPLDVVAGPPIPPNQWRSAALPLRAAATSGRGPELAFALDNTAAVVTYLEDYFGSAFPYPKLDLIGSPEFGTGAMENAGAIVYGEAALLLGENAALDQRRRFMAVHAHELSHQWFGDLVTPRWWDDAWLNESFANWMGYKAAHAARPTYHLDISPLLQTYGVMDADSRIAARQIRQPVLRNSEIVNAFDGITYLKGGAVLAMFESYLGEEHFRAGVRTHMRRFAYAVADAEDFMTSLARGSGRPEVAPAFRSFIYQAGLPLVGARLDCGKGKPALQLEQSRYLPVGSRGDPKRTWQVPLCVRYGDGVTLHKQCVLLKHQTARLALETKTCPAFVMPNADGGGYYRFALDEPGWRDLLANFGRLDEREALSAADSLSGAYLANRLSTGALLAAIRTIAQSPYPRVALAPEPILERLRDDLAAPESRARVTQFMREIYRPRLDAIGIASPAGSGHDDANSIDEALFRAGLVRILALEARDPELRSTLAGQAQRYLRAESPDGGLDPAAVDPDRAQVALQVGVQELGAPFVELLISRLYQSNDARFRTLAVIALGSTDDPALGERVRALLLDQRLRGREPTTLVSTLNHRASQRRATFDWFKANDQAFIAQLSHFAHRWLPSITADGFCTRAERDEVQALFAPLIDKLQGAERTLNETLEGIELCAALADAKGGEVAATLGQPGASAP